MIHQPRLFGPLQSPSQMSQPSIQLSKISRSRSTEKAQEAQDDKTKYEMPLSYYFLGLCPLTECSVTPYFFINNANEWLQPTVPNPKIDSVADQ